MSKMRRLLFIIALTAMSLSSGCGNPLRVDSTTTSPDDARIAEVISHDVSRITGVQGQREFLVFLRQPDQARDADEHVVLRVLGTEPPDVQWRSNLEIDVVLKDGSTMTQQPTHSRGVNVRVTERAPAHK